MNKKIFILIVSIFLLISSSVYIIIHNFTKSSYAKEENNEPKIVLECSNVNVNSNDEITCYIKGKDFNYGVSSFRTEISLGNNLSLISTQKDAVWEGATDGGIIDLYIGVNRTGNFDIASFKLKASDIDNGYDTTVSLLNTVISNESFEEKQMIVENVSIRIKSNVNTLSNLTVSSSSIVYNENIKEYSDTIDEDTIVITATKVDQTSTLYGNIGENNLNYGKNEFTITVVSESGLENVYKIVITRPDKLIISDDISVKTINDIVYLSNISSGTKGTDLNGLITTSGQVVIKNKSNNVLNDDSVVGTGDKMLILLSNESKEYIIVVPGDTNGDGLITVTDVSKLFQHYRNTNVISNNEYYYILAGDVKTDNEIRLTDVAKLFQYVRGQISSLN